MTRTFLIFQIWRVGRAFWNYAMFPFSLISIVFLLAIQRAFPTRVMPMNTSRVGHLGIDVEYALSDLGRRSGGTSTRLIIVPYRVDLPTANSVLKKMWCECTTFLPAVIGVPLLWAIGHLGLSSRLMYLPPKRIAGRFSWGADPYGVTATGAAHLEFTQGQVESSENQLRQMGLDLSRPFVCLHVRDNQYHARHSNGLWSETHRWRNLPLGNFEKAVKLLTTKGFQVVRLGVFTSKSLEEADEKDIFDYANNGFRSELLDVFLVSRCSFMISTSSGIDSLAQTFRKPLYNVGVIAPSQLYIHRNVFSIVQRFHSEVEGRLLNLSESCSLPKISDESLSELRLRAVCNSPQEIADLADEAAQRFLGDWSQGKEQSELQTRFLSLLPSEFRRFQIRGGLGSKFLLEHSDWLH